MKAQHDGLSERCQFLKSICFSRPYTEQSMLWTVKSITDMKGSSGQFAFSDRGLAQFFLFELRWMLSTITVC